MREDSVGGPQSTAAASNTTRRLGPRLLVSLALGALFAWLVAHGGVPLLPPVAELRAIPAWALPTYAGSLLLVHFFRASRWRFLIAPVKRIGLRDVILLNWIGFFAIFALPLRLGEFARPALTKARHGIPISVGLGTVAVERVVDGLITSLCVAWALLVLPRVRSQDPVASALPMYGYAALAAFALAMVALLLFLWQRKLAMALTRIGVGWLSRPLADVLAGKVDNVAEGIRSIANWKLGLGFLGESLLYWGCNALGVWALGNACGLPLELGHALAIMGVLAIGILLPAGPGLFGNFQLAISAALRLYFASSLVETRGAVFIFFLYAMQSAVMVVAGVVPLYALKLRFWDLLKISEPKASAL